MFTPAEKTLIIEALTEKARDTARLASGQQEKRRDELLDQAKKWTALVNKAKKEL